MNNKDKKYEQFCIHGHDTFVVGRYANGRCKQCAKNMSRALKTDIRNGTRKRKSHKQFCPQGHDTFIVGRDVNGNCIQCRKEYQIEYYKLYYQKNKEHIQELQQVYYTNNQKELIAKQIQWNEEHPEYNKQWKKEHPESVYISDLKKQTNRQLRVVSWTDWDKIKEVIKNKPLEMTIDHIIPLQNKLVWGLHVSWNMQYLTKPQNSKKSNKINLLKASEWYGNVLKEIGLK